MTVTKDKLEKLKEQADTHRRDFLDHASLMARGFKATADELRSQGKRIYEDAYIRGYLQAVRDLKEKK